MASLACPCGKTLHSTDEGLWRQFASFVLTPRELEAFEASVLASIDDENAEEPPMRELWRCSCGRIAIDKGTVGTEVQWYAPIGPELAS